MKFSDIAPHRVQAQHIGGEKFTSVTALVQHLGAVQAQDYAMVKWAMGVRLPQSTHYDIERALQQGEIVRTHVLRPTWHIAAAEDIHWMLMLTAPKIRSGMKARHKELELDDALLRKTNRIIEKALSGGKHLTREEILKPIVAAGIRVNDNRSSHILFSAELDGLIGSGGTVNGKYTYALLGQQVKNRKHYAKEEALALLATRYFTSHGPATLTDFTWWSGLPVGDARAALKLVKAKLEKSTINEQDYFFAPVAASKVKTAAFLLPAFDEFLISYTDRRASLAHPEHAKVISNNGIFRPVIMEAGKVTGMWKWNNGKKNIDKEHFKLLSSVAQKRVGKAEEQLANFWKK